MYHTYTCKYCNKDYTTNKKNKMFCSIECKNNYRKQQTYLKYKKFCPICGKEFSKGNNKTCSDKCARELGKQTILNKYGVDNVSKIPEIKEKISKTLKNKTLEEKEEINKKIRKTNLEKYGVEHALQSKEIREKAKETWIKKYGVDNPLKSKEILEKVQQTTLEKYGNKIPFKTENFKTKASKTWTNKYGVSQPGLSKEIINKGLETKLEKYGSKSYNNIEKTKQTCLKKYGVDNPQKSIVIKEKMKQTCLEKYGVPYHCMTKQCRESNPFAISKINQNFSKILNDNNYKTKLEFSIGRFSYDIQIINTNILIEIDPAYTHNSTIGPNFNGKILEAKNKYYHYNKTKLALENNYICIHKFNWTTNTQILNIIKNINKYKFEQKEPRLHWYNMKTKKHLLDDNFNRDEMIEKGFVEIYDDGLVFIK